MERRFKMSKMPARHTLDQFDFGFNPSIPKRRIKELATTRFVSTSSNLLMVSPPGAGRTHMAVALGMNAILQGYTMAYRSAFDLADELAEASDTGTRKKRVHQLVMPQVLIVDEFGMKTLPANAATSAILDRLLEQAQLIAIEGKPYRMDLKRREEMPGG